MRPVAGFQPVRNKGVAEGPDLGNQRPAGGRAGTELAQEAAWCLLIREMGGGEGSTGTWPPILRLNSSLMRRHFAEGFQSLEHRSPNVITPPRDDLRSTAQTHK